MIENDQRDDEHDEQCGHGNDDEYLLASGVPLTERNVGQENDAGDEAEAEAAELGEIVDVGQRADHEKEKDDDEKLDQFERFSFDDLPRLKELDDEHGEKTEGGGRRASHGHVRNKNPTNL